MTPCAPASPKSSPASAGRLLALSPRPSKAVMATANSSSVRDVPERLTVTRMGHRGDAIADTPEGPLYVPYALPGETVAVEPEPGHPDRRHLLHVDTPSPERIAPICPHFGTCG